jgi:F0F1-type ATP synthase membrane subunit b/b'
MKIWQAILLGVLLLLTPLFSACDMLGAGSSRTKQQEYYRQQLEAIKKAQDADRAAQEEYNRQLQQGLEEYLKSYGEWAQQQQQQQIQQAEQQAQAQAQAQQLQR